MDSTPPPRPLRTTAPAAERRPLPTGAASRPSKDAEAAPPGLRPGWASGPTGLAARPARLPQGPLSGAAPPEATSAASGSRIRSQARSAAAVQRSPDGSSNRQDPSPRLTPGTSPTRLPAGMVFVRYGSGVEPGSWRRPGHSPTGPNTTSVRIPGWAQVRTKASDALRYAHQHPPCVTLLADRPRCVLSGGCRHHVTMWSRPGGRGSQGVMVVPSSHAAQHSVPRPIHPGFLR